MKKKGDSATRIHGVGGGSDRNTPHEEMGISGSPVQKYSSGKQKKPSETKGGGKNLVENKICVPAVGAWSSFINFRKEGESFPRREEGESKRYTEEGGRRGTIR